VSQQDPTQQTASNPDSFAPAHPGAGYGQAPYGQPAYQAPGYPQAGYAQPGYPVSQQPAYGYAPAPPNNGMAIGSLVSSIVGMVMVPIIGSIIGVVLGHMARKAIRERGEGGDGMAVAGLVVGYVGLGIWALLLLFVFFIPLVFLAAVGTA
jgi:hypothetical protein